MALIEKESSCDCGMPQLKISKESFDKLAYDTQEMTLQTKNTCANQPITTPTVLIIFAGADLNAAAYHLSKSLEAPFEANAVVTVLVQESVQTEFIAIAQNNLKAYTNEVPQHPGFVAALQTIEKLNAKTINANGVERNQSPTIVLDFTHEQLSAVGPTGIVTLHTFRTAKEAIALCAKETVNFKNASLWHENHSCAYELVAALKCGNYFINCNLVPLDVLKDHIKAGRSYVAIDNSYHYETLPISGIQKSVVFPIGTIFAN
ncbi:uncharacterized protein LOC119670352 [Teleopsis dalmanni]|uniref:uncharacterized protein LOC119670352 n=1 Tax=Teleopsis dalmanni TaxID=139649 RepID=UPI0018CEEC5D|nr:uncharacterized protein LOC119670352 [Teleopsis dalmanni]